MKLSSVYSSLLAATLSTLGVATILIDPISSTVLVNDTLDITWSADQDYNLELHFIQQGQGNVAWTSIQTIFSDREEARGNSSYNWTVPSVAPSGAYALWLSGQGIPNDRSGYANITNWFKVEGGHEEASSGHEEGSSAHAMSTGQIAGVVVGIAMVVTLIAAAVLVLRRRAPRKAPRVTLVEAHPRESFDSIMDEKAEAKLAMRQVDV
ncbi:hypothetical protein LTR33_008184 [Friedmanniomyces endolithicus]|nr:hypothetical protein LTR33_008184 [Friedmanniomyces endolithicus]